MRSVALPLLAAGRHAKHDDAWLVMPAHYAPGFFLI